MPSESKITEVKVYRQGALITRRGKVTLKKGENEFEAVGIPLCADTDSIRLKLPGGLTASGIQIRSVQRSELADSSYTERINRLKKQINSLNIQAKAWEQNSDFTNQKADVEKVEAYISRLPERLDAVYDRITELEKERNELVMKQNAGQQETGYRFCAGLACPEDGEYPFELQYRTSQASWEPQYEFRAEDGSDQLEIRLRANVRQYTSEDWQDVSLSLYTGFQNQSNTLPELRPRRLSYQVPYAGAARASFGMAKSMNMRMNVMMDEVADAEETGEAEMPMMEASMGAAVANHDSTMSEYQILGKWNIVSGDSGADVDVESTTVKAELKRLAVPLMDDSAFLTAEVPVTEFPQIMDAQAGIYLDGNYIGNMYVSSAPSEDHYTISLGRDEQIALRRNTADLQTSQILLKNQTRKSFEYELVISNRKKRETTLEIRDQIPVSSDKTIKVDPLQLSGGELEEETGIVKWNKTLQPGETLKIRLGYAVSYTKGKNLNL